ncbi:hypothetical protein, conserved [Trypanosoma brucei brucei TREU927]|uniref:Uncharacterized protein n=1 Tax=Trypanosoma brucei brucei (strain 927/4 GUTat10.1) TaxID=185431 RepID=Q38FD1_TRYB2|nr:hypothetical protein, conserved [Trypanosoma brucei brucei TREU927]EAN76489.1 hypothetical protein, conserved [Trypanosoma brucei brucei TREU927]
MASEAALSLPADDEKVQADAATNHGTTTPPSSVETAPSTATGAVAPTGSSERESNVVMPAVAVVPALEASECQVQTEPGGNDPITSGELSLVNDHTAPQKLNADVKLFSGDNRPSKSLAAPFRGPSNRPQGIPPGGGTPLWPPNAPLGQTVMSLPHPPMPPHQLYQPPLMIPTLVPNMHPLMAPFISGMAHAPQPPPPPPPPPGFGPPPGSFGPLPFPAALNGPLGAPPPPLMMPNPPDLAVFQPRFPGDKMAASQSSQGPALSKQKSHVLSASSPSAKIIVGNASLAAHVSNDPPKFSCVLLSGISAVGKTTMGRELVNELQADGLGWVFFSGADFISAPTTRRAVWETTKEVFDALEKQLERLLDQQKEKRDLKGLVIDKNVKNVEDIFYLAALLRSKQIPFVGIVGMEADDDEVLLQRMGGERELHEKLKYHRVIHYRIRNLARKAAMYREIDANKPRQEVLNALRTKVLGCCAQPPQNGILSDLYVKSASISMVDDYAEYYTVVTQLFDLIKPLNGSAHFPGTTNYVPLSTRDMADKNRVSAIKESYGARRFNKGTRYLLMYDKGKLYLISTHLRAVLRLSPKALLGDKMASVTCAVFEGDLVRIREDPQTEIFLVFDVLFWNNAADPEGNEVTQMSMEQRHALLSAHLCSESSAFSPTGTDCVVAYRATVKLEEIPKLLEPCGFPGEGIIFQPTSSVHNLNKVYLWRPASSISVDFRIGALRGTREESAVSESGELCADAGSPTLNDSANPGATAGQSQSQLSNSSNPAGQSAVGSGGSSHVRCNEGGPTRTFELEVYDKQEKEYTQFEDCTVDVRHPDVVEGCICTCALADEKGRKWSFQNICYDAVRPAYKRDVSSLLEHSIIPKSKLLQWLASEKITPPLPSGTVPQAATSSAPQQQFWEAVSNSIRQPPPHAPPAYASAVLMQHAMPRPNPSGAHGGGTNLAALAEVVAPTEISKGHQPVLTSTSSAGVGSPPRGLSIGQPPSYKMHGLLQQGLSTSPGTKKVVGVAPDNTVAAVGGSSAAGGSATNTYVVQLLTSMVRSVRTVRKDGVGDECQSTAGATRQEQHPSCVDRSDGDQHRRGHTRFDDVKDRRERGHGKMRRATSGTPGRCMGCGKDKPAEELRFRPKDNLYCYDCWAAKGWETCRECGEFSRGYHERTRECVGEFYCNNCWEKFKEGDNQKKEGRKEDTENQQGERRRRRPKRQIQTVEVKDEGESKTASDFTAEAAGRDGAAKRRARRGQKNDTKDRAAVDIHVGCEEVSEGRTAANDTNAAEQAQEDGTKSNKRHGVESRSNKRHRRKEAVRGE